MKFGQWLGLVVLLVSLYILWQIRQLLLLVFAAVVFATALNRLVRWLHQKGMARSLALATTLALTLLLGILFFFLIVPPFVEQFQKLIELVPKVFQRMLFELEGLEQTLRDRLPQPLPPPPNIADLIAQLQPLGTEIFKRSVEFFSNSLNIALQTLLVFVLTLMFLADPQGYRGAAIKLFPSFYRRRADAILSDCEIALGNWMEGIIISSTSIAVLSGLGLAILGIDLVLVHALLAGLLNFIPNIGPTLSLVFPLMIALLDAPWKILAVVILYVIIQNIESYWLTPTVMAKQVSLLPALTLTAQIFFTGAFGVIGLLLALPLAVVAKTWIEEALFHDILDRWGNDDRAQMEIFPEFVLEPQPASAMGEGKPDDAEEEGDRE
ncbi:MAG TPA: AI-2E family transporter [Oscillatoriales cyanobacterium M59_W2019_021]|nr:AI-2E family transporter [Oscillatoriales cyanobacterium M4454_W2019_049]HIK51075.1 AI-2E family transporter [Oscillatoriales cyanobacterium M59_W2019_021]